MSNSLQIAAEHFLRPQQRRLSPLRRREPATSEDRPNEEESGTRALVVHRSVLQRIYGNPAASEARQLALRPGAPYQNERVLVDASMALLAERQKRMERHQRQQDLEEILFEINRQSVEAECVAKQKRLDNVILKSPVARRVLAESAVELLTYKSYQSEPQLRLEHAKQELRIAMQERAPSSSAAPSSFTHTDSSATPPPDGNSSWFNGTFSTARSSSLGQLTRPTQEGAAPQTSGTDPLGNTMDVGGGFPITDWQGDMPTRFQRAHVSALETVDPRALVLQDKESGWNVSVRQEKPISHLYAKKRLPLPQEETTQLPHVEEVLRAIKEQGVSAAEPRTATSQAVCALFTYGEPQPRSWRLNVVAPILSRVTDPPKPKSYREILEEKILTGEIDLSDPEIRSSVMTLFPPEVPARAATRAPPLPAKRRPAKQTSRTQAQLPPRSASAPLTEGSPLGATSSRPVSSSACASSARSESPTNVAFPDRNADKLSEAGADRPTGELSEVSITRDATGAELPPEPNDLHHEGGATAEPHRSEAAGLSGRTTGRAKPVTKQHQTKRPAVVTQPKVRPKNHPPAMSQVTPASAKTAVEAAVTVSYPEQVPRESDSVVAPQSSAAVEDGNDGPATKIPAAGASVASKKPSAPSPAPERAVRAKAPSSIRAQANRSGKVGSVTAPTKTKQPAVTATQSTAEVPSTSPETADSTQKTDKVASVEPCGASQSLEVRGETLPSDTLPQRESRAGGDVVVRSMLPATQEPPTSTEVPLQSAPRRESLPTRGSEQQYSDDDFTDGESSPTKAALREQPIVSAATAPEISNANPAEPAERTSLSEPLSAADDYEDEFDAPPEEASDPQFQDIGRANDEYSSDDEEPVGEAEGSLAVSATHHAPAADAPTAMVVDVALAEPPLEQQEGDAYANALSAALRKAKKRKDSDTATATSADVLAATVLPPPVEYLEALSGATSRSVSAEPQARPDSKHRRFSRGTTGESRPQYTARDFFSVAAEPATDSSARGNAVVAPDLASYFAARPTSRASTDNKGRTPTVQTPTSDAPTYEWSRSTPPPDSAGGFDEDGEGDAGDAPRRRKKSSKKSRKAKESLLADATPAVLTDGFEEIDVGFPTKPQKHRNSHKEKSKRASDAQLPSEREVSRGGRRGPPSGPGLDL